MLNMKATEILEKLQDVFHSNAKETNVELAEDENKDVVIESTEGNVELESQAEVLDEVSDEVTELADEKVIDESIDESETVDEVKNDEFATKEELMSLKSEIIEMISSITEMQKEYKKEVPSELSEQNEIELSEEVKEITHSPESLIDEKKQVLFSQNRPKTTTDRVFSKLFGNK